MLNGQVPLISNRRLHVGIPYPEEGLSVTSIGWRIAGSIRRRAHDTVCGIGGRQCNIVIKGVDFSRGKRRVQGQTKVRTGSFQIRGDCERAADHRAPAKHFGRPRETDAWLEVPSTIKAPIESPAGSVLAGKVDIASSEIVIRLGIVSFNPRGMRFVA